jgi:hypothetical protein
MLFTGAAMAAGRSATNCAEEFGASFTALCYLLSGDSSEKAARAKQNQLNRNTR